MNCIDGGWYVDCGFFVIKQVGVIDNFVQEVDVFFYGFNVDFGVGMCRVLGCEFLDSLVGFFDVIWGVVEDVDSVLI